MLVFLGCAKDGARTGVHALQPSDDSANVGVGQLLSRYCLTEINWA
jgi:hypothetical protein